MRKGYILGFILGAILFGSIGAVSAYTIFASDIGYTPKDTTWKVDNIEDAVDDLYNRIGSNNEVFLDNIKINYFPPNDYFFSSISCDKNSGNWDYDNWKLVIGDYSEKCNIFFNSIESLVNNNSITSIFNTNGNESQIFKSDYLRNTVLYNNNYRNELLENDISKQKLDQYATTVPILSNDNNVLYGSRYSADYSGYRAFDNNNSTRFASPNNSVNGNYIGYDFKKNISVYKVSFVNSTLNENIKTFKVQYFEDNVWKDATGILNSSNTANSAQNDIYINQIYTSSKWRIYILSSTATSYVNVARVQFYGIDE